MAAEQAVLQQRTSGMRQCGGQVAGLGYASAGRCTSAHALICGYGQYEIGESHRRVVCCEEGWW